MVPRDSAKKQRHENVERVWRAWNLGHMQDEKARNTVDGIHALHAGAHAAV